MLFPDISFIFLNYVMGKHTHILPLVTAMAASAIATMRNMRCDYRFYIGYSCLNRHTDLGTNTVGVIGDSQQIAKFTEALLNIIILSRMLLCLLLFKLMRIMILVQD